MANTLVCHVGNTSLTPLFCQGAAPDPTPEIVPLGKGRDLQTLQTSSAIGERNETTQTIPLPHIETEATTNRVKVK